MAEEVTAFPAYRGAETQKKAEEAKAEESAAKAAVECFEK